MSYRIPLVAVMDYDKIKQSEVGGYYIAGNSPTATKAEQIKAIGRLLKVRLNVQQNNVM